MIVNEIKPDTIPTWKAEFLRKEHTNVVLEKIRAEIELHKRKTESIDPYDLVGDCLDIIDKYIEGSDSE